MLDGPDDVRRKIKRAVTDSDAEIRFDPENKPGVSNLLAILAALNGKKPEEVGAELAGRGYGELKQTVTDAVIEALSPIQAEYGRIVKDKAYLEGVMKDGAERAGRIANRTLQKVMKKIGYVLPVR